MIALLEAGLHIIDRILPDPAAKAEAKLKLLELQQAGEFKALEGDLQLAQMQADVNKVEAASSNVFVSGWRPAVGWVCVSALFYNFIIAPLIVWLSLAKGWPPPPDMPLGDLLTLLVGMLGLGTLRTAEKIKGVARS